MLSSQWKCNNRIYFSASVVVLLDFSMCLCLFVPDFRGPVSSKFHQLAFSPSLFDSGAHVSPPHARCYWFKFCRSCLCLFALYCRKQICFSWVKVCSLSDMRISDKWHMVMCCILRYLSWYLSMGAIENCWNAKVSEWTGIQHEHCKRETHQWFTLFSLVCVFYWQSANAYRNLVPEMSTDWTKWMFVLLVKACFEDPFFFWLNWNVVEYFEKQQCCSWCGLRDFCDTFSDLLFVMLICMSIFSPWLKWLKFQYSTFTFTVYDFLMLDAGDNRRFP